MNRNPSIVLSSVQRFLGPLRRALDAAAAGLLLAILALTAAQVIARYLLGWSMPWGEELTRLLFVWLVFVGASRARHLSIDVLPDALSARSRRLHSLVSALFGSGILVFLIYYARNMVALTAYDRYSALGISVSYLYWAAIVGGAIWVLMMLAEALFGLQQTDERTSGTLT